jgi:hypothetical protein
MGPSRSRGRAAGLLWCDSSELLNYRLGACRCGSIRLRISGCGRADPGAEHEHEHEHEQPGCCGRGQRGGCHGRAEHGQGQQGPSCAVRILGPDRAGAGRAGAAGAAAPSTGRGSRRAAWGIGQQGGCCGRAARGMGAGAAAGPGCGRAVLGGKGQAGQGARGSPPAP